MEPRPGKLDVLRIEGHDLRSPLANIRQYAGMALARKELDPRTRRALEIIVKNADRALDLVEAWLDVRRSGAGTLELHPTPTSLPGLVRMALADEKAAADEAGVQVRADLDEAIPPLALDADRMRRAVRAIVQAALRRAPSGSTIRVRLRPHDGEVRLEVEDEGPLPGAEERERAFDPEYQMLRARRMAAGLAMALARASAEAHGGGAFLEAGPNGGATHVLRLPLARA